MLKHHLPTNANLFKRGVFGIGSEPKCYWCLGVREMEENLFVRFKFANVGLYKMFRWLRVSMILPDDLFCLVRELLLISHTIL